MVEGNKQIADILTHSPNVIEYIVTDGEEYELPHSENVNIYKTDVSQFKIISSMIHPQGVLAICRIPEAYFTDKWQEKGFALFFDGVQDPGNLGTMLRSAEWYGIDQILIGVGTVDPYSPKVVQASMGSHTYLRLYQCDEKYLSTLSCPIMVADLNGKNAYEVIWPDDGILVLGNEGQGISTDVQNCATHRITIPSAPNTRTESLNVSMACTALLTIRNLNSQK